MWLISDKKKKKEKTAVSEPLNPQVRIGHVHLKVSDLDRSVGFYRDVLGFDLTMYGPEALGAPMAYLSAGGYHHHIGLNTFQSAGGTPPSSENTGLYHLAIVYPDRLELAKAVRRVLEHGHAFGGGQTDAMTEAFYLRDPDGNGIELYRDRPREEWTDGEGKLWMGERKELSPEGLLREVGLDRPTRTS
jgi:catechol 2,3-dioxygenase